MGWMAWRKMLALRLVAVMILAGGVALVEALQQDTTPAQASYDVLNQVLQGIEINVVPETEDIVVSGVTIELLSVECSQLGVGYIQVERIESQVPEIVDEIEYERVDLQIEIKSLEVSCKISVCTTVIFLGRNCNGFLVLDSNENSQSNVTLKTKVLSEDYSRLPPAVAEEVPQSPREKVKLDGVTFTGQDFLNVIGIDLSGIVVGAINNPGSLRDSVLDPLSVEVAALLDEVTLPLNDFLVNNPISNAPQSNDTSAEAFELDVINTQTELTRDLDELVDLQNNIISSLLFDEVDGKTVLNVSSILENFGELPPTIAPLVEAVYGLPNSDLDNFDLLEVFDTFVGGGGTNEGLLFETFIENVGTIALTITNFTLSTVPPEDAPTNGLLLQILGSSTVAVPELRIETFQVHVEFALNLDINTQLLEEDLQFVIQDNGTIDLKVTDLAARVALLLTVGVEDLLDLQVGSLYDFPVDCISAVFQRAFQVTRANLNASTFVLQLGGFSDGLLILLSDLINNLILLNEAVLPEFLASQLDGLVLLDSGSCPIYPQTTENTQEPCDFGSSIVKVISDVFTAELMTSLLDDFAVPDADGIARVLSEVTELVDLEIPFGDGRKIKADILYVDVGNAVPPYFGQFELFKEESDAPQLLKTIVSVSSADAPLALFARLRLQEIDAQGKAVQDSEITVSLSFDELLVSLDILARYSDYAFNSLQFADFVRPNCALSKLDPGGGLQQASGYFRGLRFAILCNRCEDSPVLQEWANVTTLEGASTDFEAFLNGVIKDITETAVDVFDDDVFEETIARYEETCENGEGLIIIEPAEEEPIVGTVALVSTFGVLLGIFTLVSLTCRMGRDPRGKKELPSKGNSGKLESDPQALTPTRTDEELKQVPLYRHEMVPCFVRVVIPLLLVANLGLFVVGHLGDVLSIGVAASIAGLPINIESFGSFSVLSTTLELFKAGSYSLAILLFLLSVLWPYVKVVGMAVAWLVPGSWLSFRKRDNMITVLDQLGKWSLVELFFVAYILILLNVAVENPDVSFLPKEEKLWSLELLLSAETSLFSFVSALLLSLFISNVIFVYQKRIKHRAFHDFQGDSAVPDSQNISLLELSYPTFNKKGHLRYHLQVTTCGRVAVVFVMMLCMALLVAATFLPVLEVETIGLARPLIEASGDESTVNLSVASLAAMALSNVNALRVYFVVVCCATVVIIPFFQMGILIHMATRKFTLKSAILWQERNGLMSAWCATEVFVLAIVFTVLELEKATRGLVGEQCSFLTPVIEPLLALEVINSRDAAASCFALTSRIDTGLIAFLVLALLTQLVHIGVSGLFKAFIKTRAGRYANDSSQRVETNRYISLYQVLAFLGFLELSPGLVLQPNPLQQEDPSSNLQL